jgi:hypothetical protein
MSALIATVTGWSTASIVPSLRKPPKMSNPAAPVVPASSVVLASNDEEEAISVVLETWNVPPLMSSAFELN